MSKLDEFYDISSSIVNGYMDLLFSPMYTDSMTMRKSMISSIKRFINDETEILQSLSLYEIENYLQEIESLIDNENDLIWPRIKNKLLDYKVILSGHYITGNELKIASIPGNIKFSIYDTILSMVNIDVIKRLKNKIDSLEITCSGDEIFANELRYKLLISEYQLLFSLSTTEIISLYNNLDINRMDKIDINTIKNKVKTVGKDNLNGIVDGALAIDTRKVIDILSNIKKINNNSKDVFSYLVYITRMEVLISYMNIDALKAVYDYCSKFSNNNASMNNVKRLIKNKIDN